MDLRIETFWRMAFSIKRGWFADTPLETSPNVLFMKDKVTEGANTGVGSVTMSMPCLIYCIKNVRIDYRIKRLCPLRPYQEVYFRKHIKQL